MSIKSKCESCEHYDYDELTETYQCCMSLDEDEHVKFIQRRTAECPYFKFYDEYKSVRKQN